MIWGAKGKDAKTLDAFFEELGPERSSQISAVSLDLGPAFLKSVQAEGHAPQAIVCADPFHLVKLVSEALDEVRRELWNQLRFGDIVACLGAMVERFCTALDCVNTGFIPDGTLDELPLPTTLGTSRIGGIDLNKARARSAVAAALALSAAPEGFTVGDLAARARAMAGLAECDYTIRQAAYDLRKLRAKKLVTKNGRSALHRAGRCRPTHDALLVLREHVIGPIMAGCRVPMRGRRPNTWTPVDQHYEAIRRDMVALFGEIGLTRGAPVAA